MYRIKAIDPLSQNMEKRLKKKSCIVEENAPLDGVFVRSSVVADELILEELLVVARAGVGVNTINVEKCTENGTAVFNTPGANANAVKELVLSSLFISVRPLNAASQMVQSLTGEDILVQAEKKRSDFIGEELAGKTIGILGLGEIGTRLARACDHLGMDVLGYARKRRHSSHFEQVTKLDNLLFEADFVVILLPLSEETKGLIGKEELAKMKPTAVLLNFGRGEIVDNEAIVEALAQGEIAKYISDFPDQLLLGNEQIRLFPHMGGATNSALEKGDRMAMTRMLNFLNYGTVEDSVNFPAIKLRFQTAYRLTIFYRNKRRVFSKITSQIANENVEIDNMVSERKNGFVYTLIDVDEEDVDKILKLKQQLEELPEVVRVRMLKNLNQ